MGLCRLTEYMLWYQRTRTHGVVIWPGLGPGLLDHYHPALHGGECMVHHHPARWHAPYRNLGHLRRLERFTDTVNAKTGAGSDAFSVEIERSLVDTYNAELARLRARVKACVRPSDVLPKEFSTAILLFFGIRVLCIVTAIWANTPIVTTIAVSLLQFVLLPFSLHVAALHLLALIPALFGPHYVAVALLHALVPEWASVYVEIGSAFTATFLVLDQLFCLALCFETPKGRSTGKTASTLLTHFVYGFFNCKT